MQFICLGLISSFLSSETASLFGRPYRIVDYLLLAGWFGVREKHCSRLKIYDRLRQAIAKQENTVPAGNTVQEQRTSSRP